MAVNLKFIRKEHCYRIHVFASYEAAIAYLQRNPKPLGTDSISIEF